MCRRHWLAGRRQNFCQLPHCSFPAPVLWYLITSRVEVVGDPRSCLPVCAVLILDIRITKRKVNPHLALMGRRLCQLRHRNTGLSSPGTDPAWPTLWAEAYQQPAVTSYFPPYPRQAEGVTLPLVPRQRGPTQDGTNHKNHSRFRAAEVPRLSVLSADQGYKPEKKNGSNVFKSRACWSLKPVVACRTACVCTFICSNRLDKLSLAQRRLLTESFLSSASRCCRCRPAPRLPRTSRAHRGYFAWKYHPVG